jgi:hypothetical protein
MRRLPTNVYHTLVSVDAIVQSIHPTPPNPKVLTDTFV